MEEKKLKLKEGEKALKTSEIVQLYQLINPSKLTKMTDSKAKFAIIHDNMAFKAVADKFDAFQKDAMEKLKTDDFDDWQSKAQKWQGKTAKTAEEQKEVGAINKYFEKYQGEITKCLQEESDKVHAVKIETINEEQFEKLCDSNDWTVEQTMKLYEKIVG